VRRLLASGNYRIVVAQDGYLLLERSHQVLIDRFYKHPSPAVSLPQTFCSSSQQLSKRPPFLASLAQFSPVERRCLICSLRLAGAATLQRTPRGPRFSPSGVCAAPRYQLCRFELTGSFLAGNSIINSAEIAGPLLLPNSHLEAKAGNHGTQPTILFCLPRNLSGQLTISLGVRPSQSRTSSRNLHHSRLLASQGTRL